MIKYQPNFLEKFAWPEFFLTDFAMQNFLVLKEGTSYKQG